MNLLSAIGRKADLHDGCKAVLRDFDAVRIVAVQQDHPILRHNVQQSSKAQFDLVEIVKNIRVIELDIIYDQQFRQVMNELRTLVEKRRVIFVTLDYKKFRERDFTQAKILFSQFLEFYPDDFLAKMYLERALEYEQQPPDEAWNAVEVFKKS